MSRYFKDVSDHYTYLGIFNDIDYSKYYEEDWHYFQFLINPKTINRLFDTICSDNKVLTYRSFLMLEYEGDCHLFKYDHVYHLPKIEKVKKDKYRFWCGGVSSGSGEREDFHVYLNVKKDKIIFDDLEMKTMIERFSMDSGSDMDKVSVRTLQIQEQIISEIDPKDFINFVESNNAQLKFNL